MTRCTGRPREYSPSRIQRASRIQAMDPAKVDGLAKATADRQVIAFTHDPHGL